jgi:cation:H+ antiporter
MTAHIVQFAISSAVIVLAGVFLTRYCSIIGDTTKLGRLLAGGVFLAAATSLPELSLNLNAARLGFADVAMGGLLGSSVVNLLILAVVDLVHKSRGRMFSRAAAVHALAAMMSIILTAIVAIFLFFRIDLRLGPLSIATLVIAAAYVLGVRLVFSDQRVAAAEAASDPSGQAKDHVDRKTALRRALFGYALTAVIILIAGPFAATSAGAIAAQSGLGETFVGTVFVALATSLPELVATWTAVRMGSFDLAAGNVFGSNAFNILLLLPVDLASAEPLFAVAAPAHVLTCLWIVLVTGVTVMGQLYRVEHGTAGRGGSRRPATGSPKSEQRGGPP